MLSASTMMVGWAASVESLGISDPLWFAAWGAGLIGTAALCRAIADRRHRPIRSARHDAHPA